MTLIGNVHRWLLITLLNVVVHNTWKWFYETCTFVWQVKCYSEVKINNYTCEKKRKKEIMFKSQHITSDWKIYSLC